MSNIQKTNTLQRVIAIIRFVVICLMIYGAMYYIYYLKESSKGTKVFDMSYFGYLLGNVMLTFMWHHSLPALVRPVRPEKYINRMIFFSDIVALGILVLVILSAIMAFGGLENSCDTGYPCKI